MFSNISVRFNEIRLFDNISDLFNDFGIAGMYEYIFMSINSLSIRYKVLDYKYLCIRAISGRGGYVSEKMDVCRLEREI